MIGTIIAIAALWQTSPCQARVYRPVGNEQLIAAMHSQEQIEPVLALSHGEATLMTSGFRFTNEMTTVQSDLVAGLRASKPQEDSKQDNAGHSNRFEAQGTQPRATVPAENPALNQPEFKKIDVQIHDMEVSTVLSTLSEQVGINLVLQGAGDKKLSLQLTQTPFIEVLSTICNLSDLWYLKLSNMIVVGSSESLKSRYPQQFAAAYPESSTADTVPVIRLVHVNHVDAMTAAEVIRSQWKETELTVSVGPSIWTPDLQSADTSSVTGLSANVNATGSAGAANQGLSGDRSSKIVVLRGSPSVVEAAATLIKTLDYPRPQIIIQVNIVDIKNDALKELGVKWDFGGMRFTENASPGIGVMPFVRSPFDFQSVISALEKSENAKVLASPNVGVLDGRHAYVLIGDKLKYPVLTGYDNQGRAIYSTAEEKVGIYMQVAPTVAADGTVTMSIYPQVSSISGYLDIPNVGKYPQISTRETMSSIAVKSGETFVIGGLIQERDIEAWQQVPILSSIPFFGELFKWRSHTKVASQVIISITPTVIQPGTSSNATRQEP